jgi:hypothetical protein
MTDIGYSNVSNELQAQVIALLRADATIAAITTNILDGSPKEMWDGRGYPYVLCHSPEISETKLTLTKFDMYARILIEVVSEQESVARQLYDAVRDCLKSNKLRGSKAYHYRNAGSNLSHSMINAGGRMKGYWTMSVNVEYRVVGA